jgi:hypothetical protein
VCTRHRERAQCRVTGARGADLVALRHQQHDAREFHIAQHALVRAGICRHGYRLDQRGRLGGVAAFTVARPDGCFDNLQVFVFAFVIRRQHLLRGGDNFYREAAQSAPLEPFGVDQLRAY